MKKGRLNRENLIPMGIILIAVLSLVAVQAFSHNVIIGYDTFFHFNRIYDTAMQIEHHRFSYFMSTFGYCQSGQIVNAVYGPYMAYALGLLLFITHNWITFQLISATILLLGAGIGAYLLFRRLNVNAYLATAGAIIYLSQNFLTYWMTSSAFLDWGSMMLPYALMVGLDLLTGSPDKIKVTLALVVSILIEMHILSAVITVLMLIPFFVVGLWRSQAKKKYLKKITVNVCLTLLLTANYFAAFFNLFGHNHLIAPFRVQSLQSGAMQFVNNTLLQTGVGMVFMIIMGLQVFFILFNLNRSNLNVMITALGLFFLAISSEYFPWDKIGKFEPVFCDFLQFPSRFFVVAALLLLTGFLLSLNQFMNQVRLVPVKRAYGLGMGILAIVSVLMGMGNISQQLANNWEKHDLAPQAGVYAQHLLPYGYYPKQVSNEGIRQDFQGHALGIPLQDSIRANTDYLPNHTHFRQPHDLQSCYKKQITYNQTNFKKETQPDGSLRVSWRSKQKQMTPIPVVAYHDTQIKLNGKRLTYLSTPPTNQIQRQHYQLSKIGGIYVPAKIGPNNLTIKYQAPLYVKVAIIISLISWVATLGYLVYLGIRRFRQAAFFPDN